ncbi:L,D-transpeptidase [Candidatus Gottesmanbacteria bacterium]|nr:L,D-transpeptidase [Candidatus Gottesmanbacteria bacterium]
MAESKKSGSYIPSALGLIALFAAAMAFISIPMQQLARQDEPLADKNSLRMLVEGKSLPEPAEQTEAVFHGKSALAPKLATLNQVARILGVTTTPATDKRIEVDLTNQRVYAYESNIKVYDFTVSTGKWGRTPTGEFTIWVKVKSQLMSGGSKELHTYYYLPNVPWVMFFYNAQIPKMRGFSFHGTYWHDNFGTPMSHGCINMRTEEAKILYDWATPIVTNDKAWSTLAKEENPGTKVIIYGEAPPG